MLHKRMAEGTVGFSGECRKEPVDAESLAVRIAAHFAREDRYEAVDIVARDSVEIAELCRHIRAMKGGKRRVAAIARLSELCSRYGATLVDKRYALECNFANSVFATGSAKLFFLI